MFASAGSTAAIFSPAASSRLAASASSRRRSIRPSRAVAAGSIASADFVRYRRCTPDEPNPSFTVLSTLCANECAARDDKDKCEKAKKEFTDTKQRAIDWATTNEQNALKKIMYVAPPHPPPPSPPSPPPGQLIFDGVKPGFEPELEDAVDKFGDDIQGAERRR